MQENAAIEEMEDPVEDQLELIPDLDVPPTSDTDNESLPSAEILSEVFWMEGPPPDDEAGDPPLDVDSEEFLFPSADETPERQNEVLPPAASIVPTHPVSYNIGTFHYDHYLTREQKLAKLRSGFCKCPVTNYAICNAPTYMNVYMGKGTDTEPVGMLSPGDLCYVLADGDNPWVYIESGNVRGFVFSYYLITGTQAECLLAETNGAINFAKELLDPTQNSAYRYSLYTHGEIPDSTFKTESLFPDTLPEGRLALLSLAASFTGCPYLWGGDDPYTGTDCSGFVKYIYSQFGISLPRTAEEQAYVGNKIPVTDALPGDLVFMMDSTGYIYHVVIYAGDGKTLEAKGSSFGIGYFDLNYQNTCWAVRLIPEY